MAAEDLAGMRDRVEAELRDTGNATWSADEIDAHLRRALRRYELSNPQRLATTIQSVLDTREYSLSGVTGLLSVLDVWYPFYSTTPQYPPNRVAWSLLMGGTLYLQLDDGPSGDADDDVRVFYTASHTIKDLDAAAAGTLDEQGESLVIVGATAYAARQVAGSLVGSVTVSGWTPKQMSDWASVRMQEFDAGLKRLADRLILDASAWTTIDGEV